MNVETHELCACGCGRPKGPAHRGWSRACYFRWYRAGAVEGEQPPAPRSGPEYSASLRDEVLWLVNRCGESVEHAAARVGVTVETAERYLNPDAPRPECAVRSCKETATQHRRCDDHQDGKAVYEQARAAGMTRKAAAFHTGVHPNSTYAWEPGQPGVGRPWKQVAA
jgi:hypothetical protein